MSLSTIGNASPEADLTKFRWSVDHSAINEEGALLIFGWAMHDALEIVALWGLFEFADGSQHKFEVVYGTERADVARTVTDNPRALSSGYYFFGHAQRADVVSLSLVAELANGERAVLPTSSRIAVPQRQPSRKAHGATTAVYTHLARRSLQFLLSGRYRDLISAARRYLSGRPRMIANGMDEALRVASKADAVELIVDHDLGGGANQFRQTVVRNLLAQRTAVFILTFHVPTLQYVLECRSGDESLRLAINLDTFLQVCPSMRLRRIHYNNAVSFTRQLALLEALRTLAGRGGVPITYYLHDFHSVCPSHFLLDKNGKHCGVPDIGRCVKCLPQIRDGLVSLFPERDMHLWRRRWGAFLSEADEIVFFSESSKALLLKAYPQLARHPRLTLKPHDISDFPSAPVSFDLSEPLNIGIVGRINAHKGSRVIEQMAAAIDEQGLDIRITVFGALDGASKSRAISVTGSYDRNALAGLLAKHKVNMIAFTSIWPETFSFVVAEVMSLGLPVVCFDIGAPAERLKSYRLGRVVPLGDGRLLLEAAQALRDDLLKQQATPPQSESARIKPIRFEGRAAAEAAFGLAKDRL